MIDPRDVNERSHAGTPLVQSMSTPTYLPTVVFAVWSASRCPIMSTDLGAWSSAPFFFGASWLHVSCAGDDRVEG